jgi:hypothetical protein
MYKIYVVFMLLSTSTIVTRENDNSLYQSISVFVSEDTMFFFLHRRDFQFARVNLTTKQVVPNPVLWLEMSGKTEIV